VEVKEARQLHLTIEAVLPTEQPFRLEGSKSLLELREAHAGILSQALEAGTNL